MKWYFLKEEEIPQTVIENRRSGFDHFVDAVIAKYDARTPRVGVWPVFSDSYTEANDIASRLCERGFTCKIWEYPGKRALCVRVTGRWGRN